MPPKALRPLFENRRLQIALIVAASALFVYFLIDDIVMPLYTRQGSERPVPKLTGLTVDQANSVAKSVGFEIAEEQPKLGGDIPEGTILEQHPFAGSLSKPGRKIRVIPAMAALKNGAPDVVGLELRDAQLRCRNVGLISGDADLRYRFSEKVPKGSVIAQEPAAGKSVEPGTAIKLVVSMGQVPEHFYVPFLMERPLKDAQTALREAGLKMGKIARKETDLYPVGTVIAQSIKSGEEVSQDTPVDIVVAVKQGAH